MAGGFFIPKTERLFDYFHHRWERKATFALISKVLILAFLLGLGLAEAKRLGWLGHTRIGEHIFNHFFAIELAFTMLLLTELLSLVFTMPNSIAESVGKQFEILSLILVRSSFKEFSKIEEPIDWANVQGAVLHIASDAFGGLLVFILLGVYYQIYRKQPLTRKAQDRAQFIGYKKFIATLMFFSFLLIGILDLRTFWLSGELHNSFNTFYTLLIFSDILFLLIALRYNPDYYTLFRYSAFVLTTVLIRISLTAPPFYNALIGIGSLVFTILLALSFNYFESNKPAVEPKRLP
ncbi:MAG: hypothetical protein KDC66_07535 [Phaeodactylibacter sp.]|nr:hypothetical protein [Phaeodactylibacter sp.]